jgi:hypothetical protein
LGVIVGGFNVFVIGRRPICRVYQRFLRATRSLPKEAGGAIIAIELPSKRRRRMSFGEIDPSQSLGRGTQACSAPAPQVTFSRRELDRILNLYGRKVAAGEWRDYAIDFLKDRAVFSVFRRSSELPIYRIEKHPKLSRRQGAFSVISATGLIVRRGHELERVLRAIDKSQLVLVN